MKTWDEVVEGYRQRFIEYFSKGDVPGFSEQACREMMYVLGYQKTGEWISEEDMKNFIENKCYEVVRQMEWCDICKKQFLDAVERIDVFTSDIIFRRAIEFHNAKWRSEETFFLVHQFIWATDNEEYKQIWKDIIGKYEEKK